MARKQNPPQTELAKRLCEIRFAFGFTKRKEFADYLGIHPNSLGNYEKGIRKPAISALAAYKNIGASLSWIATGKGKMLDSGAESLPPHDKKAGETALRSAVKAVETGLAGAKLTPDKKAELIDLSTALLQEGKAEYLRKIITLLVKSTPSK